jgi:hypothetical protein
MIRLVTHTRVEPLESSTIHPAARSSIDRSLDEAIVAILDCSVSDETIEAAFRRKEIELGALFATVSVAAARELHRRLSAPAPTDPMATRFARLRSDRRARLLAFLADARRREALRAARQDRCCG